MALTEDQEKRIADAFADFVRRRARAIGALRLRDLNRNPLLAAVYGPELIAEMLIHQRFERGTVTSFGTTLQQVARIVAGADSGSGTSGADLEITLDQTRYFVQIKTGPKTANKDIADSISGKLNSARARYGTGARGVLGICFGEHAAVNPIARKEFESRGIEIWVGREFWSRISGDDNMIDDVLALAATASASAGEITAAFNKKAVELAEQLRQEGHPTPDPHAK